MKVEKRQAYLLGEIKNSKKLCVGLIMLLKGEVLSPSIDVVLEILGWFGKKKKRLGFNKPRAAIDHCR